MWQLSEEAHNVREKLYSCKDRALLCHCHHHHLIFIRVSTMCLVLCRLQASLCLRREEEMKVSTCQRWNKHPASSNVHVIFRKTLLISESWDCTHWQETSHPAITGLQKEKVQRWDLRIFLKLWSWYQDRFECYFEVMLTFSFIFWKTVDAKSYISVQHLRC